MSQKIPLVLDANGQLQQLQQSDSLSVEQQVEDMQERFRLLCVWLNNNGIELPDELTEF